MIKERLDILSPYLQEIKFSQNIVLVGGLFYPKWTIKDSPSPEIKFHKTGPNDDGKVLYHFYGEKNKIKHSFITTLTYKELKNKDYRKVVKGILEGLENKIDILTH